MTHIPQQVVPLFEAGIYLPMLLIIVNHDIETIENGEFKLKGPYLHLLEDVRQEIEKDLERTKQEFKKQSMRLKRGNRDKLFTEFYFYYGDTIELRRYSNIRLRNHSEFLFEQYLKRQEIN